jgi:hypothetical protein
VQLQRRQILAIAKDEVVELDKAVVAFGLRVSRLGGMQLGAQGRRTVSRAKKLSGEIDGEDLIPRVKRHLGKRRVFLESRVDDENPFCRGSGPRARIHLGGPGQCLRVDILPDVRQFAISNGNGEDPIVLERLIRGYDLALSETDD